MRIIVKRMQIPHVFGILIIASVFLHKLSEGLPDEEETQTVKKPAGNGALTVVDSNGNSDEDDGIITVEGNGSDGDIESLEDFIPTKEWKIVQEGQKIPPGLHVRMNLQTGLKEARLNEQDATTNIEHWDAGEKIGIINTEKKRFTRDELKAALKDFKYKDETPSSKEHDEEVKKKFRSYDELKKAMKDLNMSVKTEGEIVTELESELTQDIEPDRLKVVLVDLEYYLHQIDNARIFCDLGGLKKLMNLMNSTAEDIREAAVLTLGAALQSNAKVQVAAVDSGVLQQLLKMVSIDTSFVVRRKALFALSTLLRQFPFAQKKFIQLGGLSALTELFMNSKDDNLKLKIVTLLTDLMHEYDFNVNHASQADAVQRERTLQYIEIGLGESLSKTGWCGLMTSMLHSPTGHDSVEKVVTGMLALLSVCKDEFTPARPKLQALLSEYQQLAHDEKKEGSSDLFSSIHSTIQMLLKEIHRDDL